MKRSKHSRGPARVARLLVTMFLLVGVALAAGAGRTPAAAAESASDKYVACLNGAKQGDILILIDTSASLQASDAEAARVRAGEYLLRRLAKSAEDGQVELNVSLAGFANRYEPGDGQWAQLNPGSVNGVISDIQEYADRNDGRGTDYYLGLDGARKVLSERKQADPESCQAIVFFSDGALDIDRAPDEANNPIDRPYDPENPLASRADRQRAREAATAEMCRAGGLSDQVRVVPITLFGVGLTSDGSQASDFDLMRRVVEGGCGAEPGNGQFALASDIDSLLQAFDNIAGQGQTQEGAYCQGDQAQLCEEGAHDFVLDASIQSVAVLGSGDIEDPRIVLLTPGERQVELTKSPLGEAQEVELDGVDLTYTWLSQKTFSADLKSAGNSPDWTGRWRLIFFDPNGTNPQARSRTSIHISGNVFPAWPGAADAQVHAGDETPVTFGLEGPDKQPIDPGELLGTVSLDASLIEADGTETPIATGLDQATMTAPQTLDATDLSPGPASVRLRLRITTAGWQDPRTSEQIPGTELKPQLSDIPFTVLSPVGQGQVNTKVNFGSVEGPVTLSSAVQTSGPGCAWVDQTTPATIRTGPSEITQVAITSGASSPDTCVRVEDGAEGELPVTLTSHQTGNGALNGSFVVKMASLDQPDEVQDYTVDYTAEVARPLNPTNFALTLAAALILGPGIPLLLLYASKWATAKIPGRPLLTQVIDVQLRGSQLMRDGQPFALRTGDLTQMAQIPRNGIRSLDVGGAVLEAKAGRSPFGTGHVVVEAPGLVGASSAVPQPVGKANQARLPLAVHNNWVLLHHPQGPADAARVVLLVAGDTMGHRTDLVEDLNRHGPQVFSGLRALNSAPSAPPPGGSPLGGGGSPFGGGDTGPQSPFAPGPQGSGPFRPPHQGSPFS